MDNYLVPIQGEMKPPTKTETDWILACLRSKWQPATIDSLPPGDALDWENLLDLSHRERVSPLIYELTHDAGMIPPDIQHRFQQAHHQNLYRNTHLLNELGFLLDQLAKEKIAVLLLKGAALIESVYRNPGARPMADLDPLVLPETVDQARAVLEGAGYENSAFEPWPGFSRRYRQVLEYSNPDGGRYPFLIDLHWGMLDIPYYEFIPIEDIFGRADHVGNSTYLPCPEDHFLILCGHLGLHERYAAPLIRYYDLALLIQQIGENFSWDAVLVRGASWHLVIPLQRALSRLHVLWPEIVPESVAQRAAALVPTIGERRIHNLVVDRQRNPTSDVLFYFATTPGFSRKTRYFLEQAFPSPAYMRQIYCPQRPYLWPLTYFLRAGLIFQYLSRARRTGSAPVLSQSKDGALT